MLAAFGLQSAHSQEVLTLETTSEEGTFFISITWETNDIGSDNTFGISFIEPETGSILEDIRYDLKVLRADTGEQVLRRVDQVSLEQSFSFDAPGPYTILVEDIEGLGEDASVTVEVTPEFPPGAIIPVAVAIIIALVFGRNRENLFSHGWKNQ